MNFIYENNLYTIDGYDGDGRKTSKEKIKIEQKKHPFGYPPIPLSIIWAPTVFWSSWGPKISQTFSSGGEN